jgi:mono/diheme cytochrome c family protein
LRKNRFIYVLLLVIVVIGATLAYVRSRGFSAKDEPGILEAFLARRLRLLAIPGSASGAVNPTTDNPEALTEAMEHFADHCASCHGNDGGGQTAIGKGMYPKPPDMRLAATQNLTDGELYYIVQNGVRFTGMPAFGASDNARDEASWKLVRFIRHLPQLTAEELARMKDLNPKTPGDLKEEEEIKKFLEGNDIEPSNEGHKHH